MCAGGEAIVKTITYRRVLRGETRPRPMHRFLALIPLVNTALAASREGVHNLDRFGGTGDGRVAGRIAVGGDHRPCTVHIRLALTQVRGRALQRCLRLDGVTTGVRDRGAL